MKKPAEVLQSATLSSMVDLQVVPETTRSVFGQKIRLIDSKGAWAEEIRLEHVGYTQKRISWGTAFSECDYLEWILRLWIVDRIETSTDTRPIKELTNALRDFHPLSVDADNFAIELFEFFIELMPTLIARKREACCAGVRSFFRWAVDIGLPGFDEQDADALQAMGPSRYTAVSPLVALRDPSQGPYTASEIRTLNHAVAASTKISGRQRALFLLCRDWGVRPVQIALLRPADIGEDEVGPYLMVPSVKGIRRSRLRRAPVNMVRRHIADDTAEALANQARSAPDQCSKVLDRLEPIMKRFGLNEPPPMALFPCRDRQELRLERFCSDQAIYEFTLHADSTVLSNEVKELGDTLAIPTTRSDARRQVEEAMYLSCYRLRRTKGTSLVLAGHTADEVAEALDHNRVETISHYFRYSKDLHRFINETAANSVEIMNAVQDWQGRLRPVSPMVEKANFLRVGSLGLCTLGKPCPHHPTVTCYACRSFHPDIDADHEAALRSIRQYKDQLSSEATGPLRGQLEGEVNGALSLINAIKEIKQRVGGGDEP